MAGIALPLGGLAGSVWLSLLAGAAAGVFNGALARWSLKKALGSADAVFYSVYAAGLFYRLSFLAASVWVLRDEIYIIIMAFAVPLILAQLAFEVVPLKKNGLKRDT